MLLNVLDDSALRKPPLPGAIVRLAEFGVRDLVNFEVNVSITRAVTGDRPTGMDRGRAAARWHWLRKDRAAVSGWAQEFPHPLDVVNDPRSSDIALPLEWFGGQTAATA